MKKILTLIAAVAVAGSAYAGCGVKIPVNGKLESFDEEKKALVIGEKTVTLAASAKITNAEGEEVEVKDLVGKDVSVSTDKHTKKAEAVTEAKEKEGGAKKG